MKQMYRGVRLKDNQKKDILTNGMKYYWSNAEEAVHDIFYAIKSNNIMNKIVKNNMLECRINEAVDMNRIQLYGTEDKIIADSYARDTPELIFLTLQNGLISQEKIQSYLNKRYGLPHVVTFNIDSQPTYPPEINKTLGNFIAPEFITEIEQVDLTKPDPIHLKFGLI